MTLEEYLKTRNEILQEETAAESNEPNYPVYESSPTSRVGIIGAQSYSGPVGGGFLPFIPIPTTETPESEYTDDYRNAYEREYATAENMEPIRQKVQETQAPVYEPIKQREAQTPVYEPIKEQERFEAEYAAPQKQYERYEAFSPLEERAKAQALQQNEREARKEAEKLESVEILPAGNYPNAKTIEDFYREQGIYATDEGTGAGRYFDLAPQATGKGEENLLQKAFRAMTETQRHKMENIGETLAVQAGAGLLAVPAMAAISSAAAPAAVTAGTAAAASQPAMQNISNIISQSFGRVNTAGVKAAADNAFRQFLTKGTAAATGAAMAGRALVGATAETWDAGKQKMISSYPSYTAPEPVKTQQNYNYNYGATDPSRFTVPTKTTQNYASYTAPVPVKVNLDYASATGSNTKTKSNANYESTAGKNTTKYKTAY